jgi:hypothetical protein
MATIPPVSSNELIRTTWGMAVANELNQRCVKVNGAIGDGLAVANQWMTGTLIIRASPALKLQHPSNTPAIWFESNAATPLRYGHIIGLAGGMQLNVEDATDAFTFLVNSVERFRVDNAGADITGALAVVGALSAAATSLTGMLTVNPASGNECIRVRSSAPEITLHNEAGTSEYGHVAGGVNGINLLSVNDLSFSTNSTIRMSIIGNAVLVGKSASNAAVAGVETFAGTNAGIILSTIDAAGQTNLELRHAGTADASGENFSVYKRSGGGVAGSIAQGAGNAIVVNETSDYRLKNDLGPIEGGLDTVNALQPKHLSWKEDGSEFDGFIAHEVAEVIPAAVTGDKDAVLPPDDPDDPGGIDPQQLATSTLIPFLTAAIQELSAQNAALTTRIEVLEGGAAA